MLQPVPLIPTAPSTAVRTRRPELDALRVASMAGVVGIHALATALAATHSASLFPYLALDRLLNAVCVPAFLFLTGMLLWGVDGSTDARWWRRRGQTVFVPYVAWSLVYWALPFTTGQADVTRMLAALPSALVFGTAAYHLWFPPVLVLVYALTPIARRLRRASPELLAVAALVLSLALSAEIRRLGWTAGPMALVDGFAAFVPYAALGGWFAAREQWLRRTLVLPAGIAGVALLLAQALGLAHAPDLLTIIATAAALMLAVRALEATPRLGRYSALSYGVYLTHPLVLAVVREPLARAHLRGLWAYPVFTLAAYAAVLAVALAFVAGLKRRRALSWLA